MMRHAYRHVCRGTSGRNREFMSFFSRSYLGTQNWGWLGTLSGCIHYCWSRQMRSINERASGGSLDQLGG